VGTPVSPKVKENQGSNRLSFVECPNQDSTSGLSLARVEHFEGAAHCRPPLFAETLHIGEDGDSLLRLSDHQSTQPQSAGARGSDCHYRRKARRVCRAIENIWKVMKRED
jgi:hypothetical protein